MNEALQIALLNLIVKYGIDAAINIFTGVNKAATIEDAIVALKETQKKTWADYKEEAKG